MKPRLLMVPALLSLLAGVPAQASVLFNFNYIDVNVGFNDPTYGAARRNELNSVGSYLSGYLGAYTATITLDVNGGITNDNVLASAGQNYNASSGVLGFSNYGDVQTKILFGDAADPAPGVADGEVNWNFEDFAWGLGSTVSSGEYDFFSTALHELLHALGFASDILQNGKDPYGHAPGTPGMWARFDEWVGDQYGYLIDGSYRLDGAAWNAASVGGAGNSGLFFYGPDAMAANGGNPLYLYSPNPWEGGSSGSHLDDQVYGGTYIMEATTGTGPGIRTISAQEVGMLRDIGYTMFGRQPAAVPLPATVWLLIAGLASMVVSRRSRA